ncbi:hypothetical protein NQ317_015955 [Molorchus minor]|uniref:Uncharacterized protein n=1 Tax=Molorchus minor TaxID=1323400 RepID=A0ABQ9JLZ3_9CUCU|nr:hypothetical protein NQ317_015955 [Molorchus minor]
MYILNGDLEKNPNDACAWNMLGILRERLGLKDGTLEAYRNSYRLSEKEYRDLARVNYGRVLSKFGKYPQAIDLFQEVQKATFNSGSGLALALFKNGQHEESYNAYEQALHWLTQEQSSQSDLLVALASMAYMFQGADAAKTLLFQSIQLKPPSPWSLYATLSLGLLHNDTKLARLVLNELEPFKDNKDCLKHYANLLSYVYLLQGKHNKAVIEVSKLIQRCPDNPSLWLTLSILLLRHQQVTKYMSAAKCAGVAMLFGQTKMDVTKVLCLIALASSFSNNDKQAIVSAQKAVHCYPNNAEGWAVLLSALINLKEDAWVSKALMQSIIEHIDKLNPSGLLSAWLRKQIF